VKHLFKTIAPTWFARPGARASDIQQAELDNRVIFPPDYKQFLLWSNGGEGYIRKSNTDSGRQKLDT
jgi:cell wall assembly regulator SMI1